MFALLQLGSYDEKDKGGLMATGRLSKRQTAIYDYICAYTQEHGYPPSVREIGAAVGLASPSTVHTHLKVLEQKGYIKRDSKKPRTIEVVADEAPADDATLTMRSSDQASLGSTDHAGTQEAAGLVSPQQDLNNDVIALPLVGRVAAGTPILAEQNVEEVLSLPTSIVGDASSFVLKVRGQSMINAGIFDGDYIVVQQQQDAHDGEIVVALIDDSATVKTFYRERDRVRLQPENDSMEPIYVRNPRILGRVTALIRSLS